MKTKSFAAKLFAGAVGISLFLFAVAAFASHSWGGYHWASTGGVVALTLGDNVSTAWDSYLVDASADWSASSALDTSVVPGTVVKKNCRPTPGKVEVCNAKYGNNGWLGVGQIWVTGDKHITQGLVKLNDTYFLTSKYNTSAWKHLVTCQEIGHTFGLDHQDENFTNPPLGTCMDYSNDPEPNQHPNAHDYELLSTIYNHNDGGAFASVADAPSSSSEEGEEVDTPHQWGKVLRNDSNGRPSLHERNFGGGRKVFTFVFWADGK